MDLISMALRIIRSTRPRAIMLENVPALAKNRRYAAFCKGLERLGYCVKWCILNTLDYAVPQRRRRLVLVAYAVRGTGVRAQSNQAKDGTPRSRKSDASRTQS